MRGFALPRPRRACTSESLSRTITSGGKDRILYSICSLLNKGDLVDLAQRRRSFHHFQQGRLAEEGHALLVRGFLDLRGGTAIEDHGSNTIREVEKFRNRGTAMETGAVALETARALVERLAAVVGRIEA